MTRPIQNLVILMIVSVCLLVIPPAEPQQTTEMYIPIGESPGLSGKLTMMGQIRNTNAQSRTLSVEDSGGTHTFKITKNTKIWLDRTDASLPNVEGTFSNLENGRRVEVYPYKKELKETPAEWVKIELTFSSQKR